jgi:hypothetical protein
LYEGTASRDYSVIYDPGNATNFTVVELQAGVVYFFAATAYYTNGIESDFSEELVYTNGLPSSDSLQITSLDRSADGNFIISGVAAPGQDCVLLGATNLMPPVTWTPLATNVVSEEGVFTCIDLQATNYSQRFYRLYQARVAAKPGARNLPKAP